MPLVAGFMELGEEITKQIVEPNSLEILVKADYLMLETIGFKGKFFTEILEEELLAVIDLLFTLDSKEVKLRFLGDQLLLKFDLIKKGIDYSQEKNKKSRKIIHYYVSTGHLGVDREKLNYLKNKGITLEFCFENSALSDVNQPLLKTKNKKKSLKEMRDFLKILPELGGNYSIKVKFLPQNIKNLFTNVKYLLNVGVKNIELVYKSGLLYRQEDIALFIETLNKIRGFIHSEKRRFQNVSIKSKTNFLSPSITVLPGGFIYFCNFSVLEKASLKCSRFFYLGRIKEGKKIIRLGFRKKQLRHFYKNIDLFSKKMASNLSFDVVLDIFSKANIAVEKYRAIANSSTKDSNNYICHDKMLFMLTYQCQMDCRYCYMDRSHPDMSLGIIYKAIDLLFTSSSQEIELQFFGGEPLLRLDLIKKAINYAEKKSKVKQKKVKYCVTTNGLLVNEENLDFFSQYNTFFLLSIDGKDATQKCNRPLLGKDKSYSFQLLEKAICLLNKKKYPYFINFVIGPQNITFLENNVNFFLEKEVKELRFSYELGTFWQQKKVLEYFSVIFKIISRLDKGSDCRIINNNAEDEPYLISPVLTVDYSGGIYCGCTLPLEGLLPGLKRVNKVGQIGETRLMSQMERSVPENVYKALSCYSAQTPLRRLILNNLIMGEISGSFFRYFFGGETK